MHFSSVKLRTDRSGGTGALSVFLAQNARVIGQSHHLVWSLFGEKGGKRDFVYRMTGIDPSKPILIYSADPVCDEHALWDVETRPFLLPERLAAGDPVQWQIRVNATRKTPDGKRHDIVTAAKRSGDEAHWEEVAQRVVTPWLADKLKAAGLDAPTSGMAVQSYTKLRFSSDARRFGQPVVVAATDVRGTATVTDPALLREGLLKGIGAGRAYGCGMLLIGREG